MSISGTSDLWKNRYTKYICTTLKERKGMLPGFCIGWILWKKWTRLFYMTQMLSALTQVPGKHSLYYMDEQKKLTATGLIMPFPFLNRQEASVPRSSVPIRRSRKPGKRLPVNCCFLRLQPLGFWGLPRYCSRKRVWESSVSMPSFPYRKICFYCPSFCCSYCVI